jgi:hypothetical protein
VVAVLCTVVVLGTVFVLGTVVVLGTAGTAATAGKKYSHTARHARRTNATAAATAICTDLLPLLLLRPFCSMPRKIVPLHFPVSRTVTAPVAVERSGGCNGRGVHNGIV